MQGPIRHHSNLRAASTEVDTHACRVISLFVHLYVCVHMYIVADPLPCGKISRAAFYWDKLAGRVYFRISLKRGKTHCGKFEEGANPNPKGGATSY